MSFGGYLAGCAGLIVAIVSCGAIGLVGRRWLVPGFTGPVAAVATVPLAVVAALIPALLLGSFGLFKIWAWLPLIAASAVVVWRFRDRLPELDQEAAPSPGVRQAPALLNAIGLGIAAVAFGLFAAGTVLKLGGGMTVFDTHWYHGPLSVSMAQTGDTFSLHHVAPAFLAWFYPQNSELIHGIGIVIFGNDLISPLINLGWFSACLLAAWAIGRPYGAAPISVAGVALILGSVAMADQAGEGRNDIVGGFFVLAGVAVLLNSALDGRRVGVGPAVLIALCAGLAAGTKINFIPAAVILIGAALWLAVPGRRRRVALASVGAALVGGGYWYLRNLIQSGNPLPWIRHLGPITLPGPTQETGGRDAGSVLDYLGNIDVIRDWFLPGLHESFGSGWVVVLLLALAGMVVCLAKGSDRGRRVGGVVGLALLFAWLAAPTSASGPHGSPSGFLTGLRYVTPALMVGLALLGCGIGTRGAKARWVAMGLLVLVAPFAIQPAEFLPMSRYWPVVLLSALAFWAFTVALVAGGWFARPAGQRVRFASRTGIALIGGAALVIVLIGQPIQRHYFAHRYVTADYVTPGLAATFAWARGIDHQRIGTTASRMYPLYGLMLDNKVGFIGDPRPNGGFVRPDNCVDFVRTVNAGEYRYVAAAYDRLGPGQTYPEESDWLGNDPAASEVLRREGAVVFELNGPLSPEACLPATQGAARSAD